MALFTVYQNTDDGNTSVPNLFIDEYMKEANDAQIKVYLYIVRMMNARRATSLSDMADHFNHTEKEVLRSLRYWEKMGVLTLDFSADGVLTGIHLCELKAPKEEDRSSGIISITPDRAYTDKETSRKKPHLLPALWMHSWPTRSEPSFFSSSNSISANRCPSPKWRLSIIFPRRLNL